MAIRIQQDHGSRWGDHKGIRKCSDAASQADCVCRTYMTTNDYFTVFRSRTTSHAVALRRDGGRVDDLEKRRATMSELDPNKCWNCGSSEPCDRPPTNWWFAARNPGWYEVCCDEHNASKVKAVYPPELTREQALDYTE